MGIPKLELDDLTFEELVSEARALIPRFSSQWTDHNLSDPGMTLVDLFAWLTETSIYRVNLLTEGHVRKYLQLLGIVPRPATAAVVELTFESDKEIFLEKSQVVSTEFEDKKVYFELASDAYVSALKLEEIICDERTGVFNRTNFNDRPERFFAPFGEETMDGATMYLGFKNPSLVVSLFVDLYEDDLIDTGSHGDEQRYSFTNAKFRWYYSGPSGQWIEIKPCIDETEGFKYRGRILFEALTGWSQKKIVYSNNQWWWLKCCLEESHFEYPPRIKAILTNTFQAVHGLTIRKKRVFEGTGLPGQTYKLDFTPVMEHTVRLTVNGEPWQLRPDFYGSGPDDRHFVVEPEEGKIIFGDGLMGAVPPYCAEIVVTEYRTGGGPEGNLPSGLSWTVEGVSRVKAINHVPARGGKERETIEEARFRFLRDLRVPYRAVNSEDFQYIAKNTPGLRIAQTKAFVKDDTVKIVVVPFTPLEVFSRPPEPSDGFIMAVCRHIDRHRLLGTRFSVVKPEYIKVWVKARIKAITGYEETGLKERINSALNRYLHPVTGGRNATGWPVGRSVYLSEIYSLLEGIKGLNCILDLSIQGDNGARVDPEGNLILPSKRATIYPGNHYIEIFRTQETCRGRVDGPD